MKASNRRNKRKSVWIKLTGTLVVLFAIIQLLPDNVVFSDFGRSVGLPTLVKPTNSFYKPIQGETIQSDKFQLIKNAPGLSASGAVLDSTSEILGETVLFPQMGDPKFEFNSSGDTVFRRMKAIKMYPAEDVRFTPFISQSISEHIETVNCSYEMFDLSFEEVNDLYFVREKYNNGLLERQQIANGVHFKLRKGKKNGKECLVIEKDKADNDTISKYIQKRVAELNDLIDEKGNSEMESIFDMEYMSDFLIYSQIMGRTKLHRMRWVYRLTNGKIYPIADGHKGVNLRSEKKIKGIWKQVLASNAMKARIADLEKNKVLEKIESRVDILFKKYAGQLSSVNRPDHLSQRELNFLIREEHRISKENITKLAKRLNKARKKKPTVSKSTSLNAELTNYLSSKGVKISDHLVTFTKGEYVIERDVILPRGYNLKIKSGTTIRIAAGKSIIVNGCLSSKGTKEAPIVITNTGDLPFGVVGAIANGRTRSEISYTDVSNGSEAYIDGKFLSGALSIYHQDCTMKNSTIHNNYADDGLNVKYAAVKISNCEFSDNWADQVDLDFCTGKIESCQFKGGTNDSNGDGLDLSGSQLELENTQFLNLSDKGVSIGEQSTIHIDQCLFSGNNNAITSKDLSLGYISECRFENNKSVFGLYQKKPIFGGATLKVESNNEYIGNLEQVQKDRFSTILYK